MINLLEILNVLTWVSRGNTVYRYSKARTWDDVLHITAQCIVTECMLHQAKNILRSQHYRK